MYNNYGYGGYGFPYGQQPLYQPQQMPMKDNRTWVQGEVGAKAYLVAPGNTEPLWDSEQPVIWLKSVSYSGVPSLQRIPYTFDNPQGASASADIETRISAIEEKIKALEAPKEENSNE